MGILDRLFRGRQPSPYAPHGRSAATSDERALARYRYLLRTAPPEALEQAHAEAFARLTPEQRAQVLRELSGELPPSERSGVPTQADPQVLARMATRAEMRQPGFLERTLGGSGMGMGGMFAGSLLSSVAGAFIGSAIAHQFLDGFQGGSEPSGGSADADASPEPSHADFDGGGGDFQGDFEGDFGDV